MNVIAIASSPRTRTGPPFERLYAVEPDGVEQIIPSHDTTPRSSPAIAQPSSIIRPSVELVATTSLTATNVFAVELRLERRLLDRPVLAGEDAREVVLEPLRRDRGEEADPAEVDADHRYARAEQPRERAEDRPVAADGDRELRALRLVDELHAGTRRRPPAPAPRPRARRRGRARRPPPSQPASACSIRSSRSSGSVGCSECTR